LLPGCLSLLAGGHLELSAETRSTEWEPVPYQRVW
jgi:hypothetical protein